MKQQKKKEMKQKSHNYNYALKCSLKINETHTYSVYIREYITHVLTYSNKHTHTHNTLKHTNALHTSMNTHTSTCSTYVHNIDTHTLIVQHIYAYIHTLTHTQTQTTHTHTLTHPILHGRLHLHSLPGHVNVGGINVVPLGLSRVGMPFLICLHGNLSGRTHSNCSGYICLRSRNEKPEYTTSSISLSFPFLPPSIPPSLPSFLLPSFLPPNLPTYLWCVFSSVASSGGEGPNVEHQRPHLVYRGWKGGELYSLHNTHCKMIRFPTSSVHSTTHHFTATYALFNAQIEKWACPSTLGVACETKKPVCYYGAQQCSLPGSHGEVRGDCCVL